MNNVIISELDILKQKRLPKGLIKITLKNCVEILLKRIKQEKSKLLENQKIIVKVKKASIKSVRRKINNVR